MTWRHRQPHELDHELLWLLISCAILPCAVLWLKLGLPWPICLFHAVTHHPCLACGATRCFMALSHGDFNAAFWWNPLVFFAYLGIALFDAYALVVLLFNLPRFYFKPMSKLAAGRIRILVLLALATNWIYLWRAGI